MMRDTVSNKNPYYIPKYRRLELKYYCLQYPIWEQAYNSLSSLDSRPMDWINFYNFFQTNMHADPVAKRAIAMQKYSSKMDLIKNIAKESDEDLAPYILLGVTKGKSYEWLYANMQIPCSKDTYYSRCRKFFWLLNKHKD